MSSTTAATADLDGDRSGDLIASTVVTTIFASIFCAARLWARICRTSAFGWDDGFIIVAWAATIATAGMSIASAANGYGKHMLAIPTPNLLEALKFSNFGILTNGIAMGTMKMSIGFSMLRIQLARTFTVTVWVTMALSVLVNLNVLFGCFKSCTPMEKIWNPAVEGTCWPVKVNTSLAYLQSAGNIITDLLLTFGLLFCLTRLRLSTYNKWALRSVFLIGLVATISAVVKLSKLPILMKTQDPTWDGVDLSLWVNIEMNCGLFAASLPPLKATFEGILVRYFGIVVSTKSTQYGTHRNYGNGYDGFGTRLGGRGSAAEAGMFPDECDEESGGKQMGHSTAFMLDSVRNKSGSTDGLSVESDQRHILEGGEEPGQGGQYNITKTVGYTISEEVGVAR